MTGQLLRVLHLDAAKRLRAGDKGYAWQEQLLARKLREWEEEQREKELV